MGPTNLALVKLFQADQQLREAQGRLDAVTKNVRIQERRNADLSEKLKLAQSQLKEAQVEAANLDLDIRTREVQIEKLRTQQQTAKNNKEYQAFLVEINTGKVDKSKVEDQALKTMETVETLQKEVETLSATLATDSSKLEKMKSEVNDRAASIQAEIDRLKPDRDEAAAAVPARALQMFDRMAEYFEGEALAPLTRPNKRHEEYVCGGCHMDLVTDVYNKLHSRDDLIQCPSCKRILYIPDDLPPELAVNQKKTAAAE